MRSALSGLVREGVRLNVLAGSLGVRGVFGVGGISGSGIVGGGPGGERPGGDMKPDRSASCGGIELCRVWPGIVAADAILGLPLLGRDGRGRWPR